MIGRRIAPSTNRSKAARRLGADRWGDGGMNKQPEAFFVKQGDAYFGTDATRGPWSEAHCHAGPVTGLLARAVEAVADTEKTLMRLTVDLLAPVPLDGIYVTASPVRAGRTINTARAEVTDQSGRVCATATSMHLAAHDIGPVNTAPVTPMSMTDAKPAPFIVPNVKHPSTTFANYAQVAYPAGETSEPGPTTIWMKTLPLLVDEPPSSFQRLCMLADCSNGISRNHEMSEFLFLNTDITIARHRVSDAEWIASAARSEWHSTGLGLSSAILQDEQGPIATVLQTLVLNKVSA